MPLQACHCVLARWDNSAVGGDKAGKRQLSCATLQGTWIRCIRSLKLPSLTTQVCLSALAWWDGSAVGGDKAGEEQLSYVAFAAGVSEVEIDCLTGEKLLLRSDILFDCGHSLNPGIDIGQVHPGSGNSARLET